MAPRRKKQPLNRRIEQESSVQPIHCNEDIGEEIRSRQFDQATALFMQNKRMTIHDTVIHEKL